MQPFQSHSPVWSISIDQGGGYIVHKILVGPYPTAEAAIGEIQRQQNLYGPNGLSMLPKGKVSAKPRDSFKPLPPAMTAPLAVMLQNAPGVEMIDDE